MFINNLLALYTTLPLPLLHVFVDSNESIDCYIIYIVYILSLIHNHLITNACCPQVIMGNIVMKTIIRVVLLLLCASSMLAIAILVQRAGGPNVEYPVGILTACSVLCIGLAVVTAARYISGKL